MLLHQLVHLSTGNRQVFAPEHQSVFMHPLDLRFRRVHQGQRFETFRQVSRYRERWIRQVHRLKNVQQEPENLVGHRWLERGLEQVLAYGSRPRQKARIRQERDQVSSKESFRRSRSRLGISRVQRRWKASGQGQLRQPGAGTEGGVREGGFEDRKAETFADVGDAGWHRVHRQRLRYTQIERVPGFRQSPLLRLPLVLRACRQSPRPPLSPGGGQRVQLRHRIDDRNARSNFNFN